MDSNKTIVFITGASGGIGFETASLFATISSYHVIVGARSIEKGEKAVSEIKSQKPQGTISFVQIDVTDDKSINDAAAAVEKDFGRVDVLINNAGIISHAESLRGQLRETFETNTIGAAVVSQTFSPLLLSSQKAKMINISSGLGSITLTLDPKSPYYKAPAPAYMMSKAAMNMLTAYESARLGDQGVKVWSYCPGYVVTNLTGTGEKGVQERIARGAKSPKESADGLLAIVEGKRDADVGMFLHKDGIYGW
ncbi:Short-chain dehydrogenase/reductase [Lachnellula occidentalis]|uniref:Short-chain dehydrogenase/reductase n=1 Tax=Lachnellula occidentalis TaxID=215460 RepID=A0A8H8S2P1_9HELO|nr:Short-chain dehydrogenase/reductase [Lachnellula occidentalis]